MDDRYTCCRILSANGVACTCWFEDAVAYHGVPTSVYDLCLLVQDMDAAAAVLIAAGWTQAAGRPNDKYSFFSAKECKPYRRLTPSAESKVHTFLFNAADWCFPVEHLGCGQFDPSDRNTALPFFPSLSVLVDALIDSLLDAQDGTRTSRHLTMMLAYLYGYVSELKNMSFAKNLAYDHQQFHYDTQSSANWSLRFLAHERKVRQQLRDRTLTPHYDPWNNERECLS